MQKIKKIDNIFTSGEVTITLRGPDGRIKSRVVKNLVVNTGKYHIADQLTNQAQAAMSHMAIGDGDQAGGAQGQLSTDTALQHELVRVSCSKTQGSGSDANQITYLAEFGSGIGTGQITEAGIFNSATLGGDMLCRTAFTMKDKGSSDTLTLTWVITIAAAT